MDGHTPLIFLNEYFNINLTSQFGQTLAGFIMEQCGRMPEKDFKLETEGMSFIIKTIDGNKIEKVFMQETQE